MSKAKEKDSGHSFEAYFKRALTPILVLKLLSEKPMYVYEITQELKIRSNGIYIMNVLYPVLYRLEEQGYVKVSHTEVEYNRARTYYVITDNGIEYLKTTRKEFNLLCEFAIGLVEGI